MTPKEKAEQLIYKYNYVVLDTNLGGSNQRVKKCALIVVDEIIKYIDWHEFETPNEQIIYWLQVKKEIENL